MESPLAANPAVQIVYQQVKQILLKVKIQIIIIVLVGGDADGASRRHRASVNHAAAAIVADHGTNNFATIRTTSIVTKQQKEHMQVSRFSSPRYTVIIFRGALQLVPSS